MLVVYILIVFIFDLVCSQLEMLSAQPPQLLAMLGFSSSVLQNEIQKHRNMEKLKVVLGHTFV